MKIKNQSKGHINTKPKKAGSQVSDLNLNNRQIGRVWNLGESVPQAKGKGASPFSPGRGSKGR